MSVEALISTQVIDTTSVGRSVMTAADAAAARTAIGAGTGSGDLVAANNLSDLASAATARTNLGLGTLATQSGTFSGTSSGTNTGDQTTVSGNAGSATVLQTARTINGVSFDGSASITVTAAGSTLSDTVTVAKGGTGLTALGTALQVLRVNAGATALEYAAAGGGIGGATGATDNSVLRADGTGGSTLQNSAFVIADNATASPNNTVNHASIQATGGTTNVSVSIVPKGTGAFTLTVPDGTSAGGNARGANAVDLQTLRDAASQVASGTGSGLLAGRFNTNAGLYSIVLGGQYSTISGGTDNAIIASYSSSNGASGNSVVVGGNSHSVGVVNNTVILGGQFASGKWDNAVFHSSGRWSATGDRQSFQLTGSAKTTTNAAVEVNFGLGVGNIPVYVTVAAGRQISGTLLIQGIKSDGSLSARYTRQITIRRVSNTTTLDESVTVGTDLVNGTSLSVTADDVNDRLNVSPTGVSGEIWRWNCRFDGIEQAYGI